MGALGPRRAGTFGLYPMGRILLRRQTSESWTLWLHCGEIDLNSLWGQEGSSEEDFLSVRSLGAIVWDRKEMLSLLLKVGPATFSSGDSFDQSHGAQGS